MTGTPRADAVRAWIAGGRVGPIDWPVEAPPRSWRNPLWERALRRINGELRRRFGNRELDAGLHLVRTEPTNPNPPRQKRGAWIGGKLIPPPPRAARKAEQC